MFFTVFKRLCLFFILIFIQMITLLAIPFSQLALASQPNTGFLIVNVLFILGMMVTSLINTLFFQEIFEKHSRAFATLLLAFFLLTNEWNEWLMPYEIYATFLWSLIFMLVLLKASHLKCSLKYFTLFIVISITTNYPMLWFSWTSDFSQNKNYESYRRDHVFYRVPSVWGNLFEQMHQNLPEDIKNTKVVIVGLTEGDLSKLGDSVQFKDYIENIGGMTIANPLRSLIVLSLKDFSQEYLESNKNREMEILYEVVLHEMTHVQQIEKYGMKMVFFPNWKKEGHATYRANNFSLSCLYEDLKNLNPQSPPYIKDTLEIVIDSDWLARMDHYPLFQLQGWYYLGYLGMDLDAFFSDAIDLADWTTVKEAWLETYKDWIAEYESKQNKA